MRLSNAVYLAIFISALRKMHRKLIPEILDGTPRYVVIYPCCTFTPVLGSFKNREEASAFVHDLNYKNSGTYDIVISTRMKEYIEELPRNTRYMSLFSAEAEDFIPESMLIAWRTIAYTYGQCISTTRGFY